MLGTFLRKKNKNKDGIQQSKYKDIRELVPDV